MMFVNISPSNIILIMLAPAGFHENYEAVFGRCGLKVPLKVVIWIYCTLDSNLGVQNYFEKYLKESCKKCSYTNFISKIC